MYHKLTIVGNLGSDPIMKYTPDGKAVTTFSVAASNKKDETVWFRVSTWEKQAEVCNQYLHKGSKVLVEGRLNPGDGGSPRMWQKTDGSWASNYEVTADKVRFLSGKSDDAPDDDVPF